MAAAPESAPRGTKRSPSGMDEFREHCKRMTHAQRSSIVDCRAHLMQLSSEAQVDTALEGSAVADVDDLKHHITSMVTPCVPDAAVLNAIRAASCEHRVRSLAEELGAMAFAAAAEGEGWLRCGLKNLQNYAPWVESEPWRSKLIDAVSPAGRVTIGDDYKYQEDLEAGGPGFDFDASGNEYRDQAIWIRWEDVK